MANPKPAATVGNRSGKIGTGLIALAFVALFIVFWGGLLLSVFTAEAPVELAEHQETILAFLATTVATGTAAVLGINVVSLTDKENTDGTPAGGGTPAAGGTQASSGTTTFRAASVATGQALKASIVLWIGVGAYLIVGVLVLVAWFYRADVAPDALSTFGSSVLGWLAGAFAGVFKASTN